jgi:hypothetical protein
MLIGRRSDATDSFIHLQISPSRAACHRSPAEPLQMLPELRFDLFGANPNRKFFTVSRVYRHFARRRFECGGSSWANNLAVSGGMSRGQRLCIRLSAT